MSSRLEFFIDKKLLKLIRLFLKRQDELFSLYVISQETKVSIGSTFRLIKNLVDSGLVSIIKVGKTKLYKTNEKHLEEFMILKAEVKHE